MIRFLKKFNFKIEFFTYKLSLSLYNKLYYPFNYLMKSPGISLLLKSIKK